MLRRALLILRDSTNYVLGTPTVIYGPHPNLLIYPKCIRSNLSAESLDIILILMIESKLGFGQVTQM